MLRLCEIRSEHQPVKGELSAKELLCWMIDRGVELHVESDHLSRTVDLRLVTQSGTVLRVADSRACLDNNVLEQVLLEMLQTAESLEGE